MLSRTAVFAAFVVSLGPLRADILISQYDEGSGSNKWIELSNTSETAVVLSGYGLASFTNETAEAWKMDGAVFNNSLDLSGFSIAGNGFLLIGNPDAVLPSYGSADVESAVTFFNGNDSVVLYDTSLGSVGDTAAIVDALSFTDAGEEGGETSFYRLNESVGYDLMAGTSILDFPAVWGQKTPAEVDAALPADPWYLSNFASTVTEELTVTLDPASVAENGGTGLVDVTVARTGSTAAALDVTLSSGDMTEAVIPLPNRQIPAGESEATFPMAIDAVDDILADGAQVATITATAAGLLAGTAELTVTDDGDVALLAINEILADPPPGIEGDANGDGARDGGEDEFVELVNLSGVPLDISFWEIHEGSGLRHIFPPDTVLPPDCAVVVFGGGSVAALGGAALYQIASNASNGSLSLNNGGDTVTVFDESLTAIASYSYGGEGGNDESLTRDPDVTGGFVGHTAAAGASSAFSPGTLVDGSQFCAVEGSLSISLSAASMSEDGGSLVATITRSGDLSAQLEVIVQLDDASEAETDLILDTAFIEAGEAEVDVTITAINDIVPDGTQVVTVTATAAGYSPGSATFEVLDDGDGAFTDLVINEILYDPPPDAPAGDANGDGTRQGSEDEFVEIVNVSGADFDLSDFQLIDGSALRHVFPFGTILADGQAIVVFGGGAPFGHFGGSVVQVASTGLLGLNNGGDSVILAAPDGSELLRVDYDGSVGDESLTRDPDLDASGTFVAHAAAAGAGGAFFSPGTMIDGSPFPGGSSGPGPIVIVALGVDVEANTVTVTVSGLEDGVSYDFDSSIDLGDGDPWQFITFFTTADGTEVTPGVFEFTFADESIAVEPVQFYRVSLF